MCDIKFNCRFCRQSLEAPPDMAGESIECPACKGAIAIPSPSQMSRGAEPCATGRQGSPYSESEKVPETTRTSLTPSILALVAANLVPAVGVLWLHWDVYPLVSLYWMENGVIGFFTVLRMLASASPEPYKIAQKVALTPFFLFHYGGFWLGHGVFVVCVFGNLGPGWVDHPSFAVVRDMIITHDLRFAVIGLAGSHAFSFVWHYLIKGERNYPFLMELQEAPYRRVVVLHLFILSGGFLMMHLHSPTLGMLALVALKTVADVWEHSREHRRLETKRHTYLQKIYERADKPADPFLSDSLQQAFPGYSRDLVAEKRHRRRASRVFYASVLCVPIGIVALSKHHTPIALCLFGVSAILLVISLVMYNVPPRVLCNLCQRRMEPMITRAHLQELPRMQRLMGTRGMTQKWFVCHRCKKYFLCVLRGPE